MSRFAFLKCHPGYLLEIGLELSAKCHKAFNSWNKLPILWLCTSQIPLTRVCLSRIWHIETLTCTFASTQGTYEPMVRSKCTFSVTHQSLWTQVLWSLPMNRTLPLGADKLSSPAVGLRASLGPRPAGQVKRRSYSPLVPTSKPAQELLSLQSWLPFWSLILNQDFWGSSETLSSLILSPAGVWPQETGRHTEGRAMCNNWVFVEDHRRTIYEDHCPEVPSMPPWAWLAPQLHSTSPKTMKCKCMV